MLQVFQRYVARVYSKCLIYFRCMLQVFYLDVAYVAVAIHICWKRMLHMFHLFQLYMLQKYFMLQVRTTGVSWCRRGPQGQAASTTWGGGAVRRRQCGEKAQAARCRCG
jgi:hypothetical protein